MEHKIKFQLDDLPEFQRFLRLNPSKNIGAQEAVLSYCGAIHWLSILEFLNPIFQPGVFYSIEVGYLFANDPDEKEYPDELYQQMQVLIARAWEARLREQYPARNWTIDVRDDPELTIEVYVESLS